MTIILASASKNRQELLNLAQIPFRAIPSDLDESLITGSSIPDRIEKLAIAKAEAVRKKAPKGIIIACDTVGEVQGKILEKPKFKMTALERLIELSNTHHIMYTGWAVLNARTGKLHSGVVKTTVWFSKVTREELERYVNDNPVVNWAAGYSPMNSWAVRFIEKIDGSVTGFTHGLPLETVIPALKKEGIEL